MECSCSMAGTRFCDICETNPKKRSLSIVSASSSEFVSDIVVEGQRYHVQTERLGPKKPVVVTRVFRGGEIISSKKTDYGDLPGGNEFNARLHELMRRDHQSVLKALKSEKPRAAKASSAYLDEVQALLRVEDHKRALKTLADGLAAYPYNPFLLSYYGCLDAIVNHHYERGVDLCLDAIEILKEEVPFGKEHFYPIFFLNLGRAYLAAGDKKNAAGAFAKGLSSEPRDPDLLWEVRRLGTRRKPVLPFLRRSNPLNKYIGILLQKLQDK